MLDEQQYQGSLQRLNREAETGDMLIRLYKTSVSMLFLCQICEKIEQMQQGATLYFVEGAEHLVCSYCASKHTPEFPHGELATGFES